MRQGWRCPVCGAGVSPDLRHCMHPPRPQALPEGFPDAGALALAKAAHPALDVEREAGRFRAHYAGQVTARPWAHIWKRWLEGEEQFRQRGQRPAGKPAQAVGTVDAAAIGERTRAGWIKVKRVDESGKAYEAMARREDVAPDEHPAPPHHQA